ncbi:MAG TPA: hypothetical protein EYG76_00675 [Methanothermococcus okinawensis]|uniref:Uncharacterized protein n=1 Tax=Methanothermococcus okinawensis TaxID=155863 RepID=A0A832YRC4_9EURY|nr:hypothetical protein [Methanothermococcus okinawensis]
MMELRGKSIKDIMEKLRNIDIKNEERIYINTELSKDLIIYLLENSNVDTIYLPISKYNRTNKKLIKALEDIGLNVEPLKVKTGRPSKNEDIVANHLDKKPLEISKITGINPKTVEYHYYKLKNKIIK